MMGRIAVIALILVPILVGGGIWYAQEYGYYDEIDPAIGAENMRVATENGPVKLDAIAFEGIDADSSPLRWRACFRVEGELPEAHPFENATPLYGPGWFDCFDADQIGHDLESGAAKAVLGQAEIHPDVDRVLAVYPDGRVFGWHQYNDKTPERGVMD